MGRQLIYCEKCGRAQNEKEFMFLIIQKISKWKLKMVFQCTQIIGTDLFMDSSRVRVPYVPENGKLLEKYASDPKQSTGMTILVVICQNELKQFKDYRWKDTEFLQEVANNRVEQAMKRQGYGAAEIAQQLAKTNIEIPEEGFKEPVFAAPPTYAEPEFGGDDYFGDINGNDSELVSDLTEEDKTYLRLKWGKAYKPEEWVRLEQLYQEMKQSYDVQGAGHEDVLKLVCKTSLKANQLLDIGDVDGAQKMVKMYDSLMKSGKFTAAQNKAQMVNLLILFRAVEFVRKKIYSTFFQTAKRQS